MSFTELMLGLHASLSDGRWRRCLLEPMCTAIYMHRSVLLQQLRKSAVEQPALRRASRAVAVLLNAPVCRSMDLCSHGAA